MTVRVKIKKSLTLNTLIPRVQKEFTGDGVTDVIKEAVKDHIAKGISPVEGEKWKDYTEAYAKKHKKNISRVDMELTGKMLSRLQVSKTKRSFRLFFNSEVAKYHDQLGAGVNKVIRRLLPTNRGERFNSSLTRLILKKLNQAVKNAVSRGNR